MKRINIYPRYEKLSILSLLLMTLLTGSLLLGSGIAHATAVGKVFTMLPITGRGTVTPSPGTYTYSVGQSVTITAKPASGYILAGFLVDGVDSGALWGTASISITMNTDHTVEVIFISISGTTRTLIIRDAVGGTTNPPEGVTTYNARAVVTLTAIPDSGYHFVKWNQVGEGPLTGNPITTTMNSDQWYQPVFAQEAGPTQYTLTVAKSGTGTGSVALSPAGGSYASGTVVKLTASPSAGSGFTGWGGALSGSANPEAITMNGNKAVTATFTQAAQTQYTVTVTTIGQGTVAKSPSQSSYASGTTVQLTATPASGYTFSGWGGDLSGSANSATLTVDGDKAVTATFTQATQPTNGVTHTVYKSGSTYYARTEATGAVKSSSDFKTLFQSIFVNNAVIQVQPATYLIQSVEGLYLLQRSNVKVYGASGVVFKQALSTAAIPSQVMDLNTCTDVYFYDVVFDQDYQNPNHLTTTAFGVNWIIRVAYGSNNWFTRCQFINGVGCGIRIGGVSGVHFIDCTINHCGEHAFYGSNQINGMYVENCRILNYGKYGRGMNKIQESSDVHFTNCWFEPNQDGKGYGTPPSLPGFSADPASGVYGIVIAGDSDFYFTGCTWKNANSNTQRNVGLRLTSNIANYNINFNDCHWIGFGSAPVIDAGTCYSSNVTNLHLTSCTFN